MILLEDKEYVCEGEGENVWFSIKSSQLFINLNNSCNIPDTYISVIKNC